MSHSPNVGLRFINLCCCFFQKEPGHISIAKNVVVLKDGEKNEGFSEVGKE